MDQTYTYSTELDLIQNLRHRFGYEEKKKIYEEHRNKMEDVFQKFDLIYGEMKVVIGGPRDTCTYYKNHKTKYQALQ